MIRLHQFAPAFGLPNASPSCLQVRTDLRMAGLPSETVNHGNILQAPKCKLPTIEHAGTQAAELRAGHRGAGLPRPHRSGRLAGPEHLPAG